jgi:hypothetical protein
MITNIFSQSLIIFFVITILLTWNFYVTEGQIEGNELNSFVYVEKDSIQPAEIQTLYVQIINAKNNEPIKFAYVDGIVRDSKGFVEQIFAGLTDGNGKISHTWKINENAIPGEHKIYLDIISTGFKPLSHIETFTISKE